MPKHKLGGIFHGKLVLLHTFASHLPRRLPRRRFGRIDKRGFFRYTNIGIY